MLFRLKRLWREITDINGRAVLSTIALLSMLWFIAWYFLLQLESKDLELQLGERQEKVLTAQQELQKITSQWPYRRFKIAQLILSTEKRISREQTISYLIDLFDQLQSLDVTSNISLDDFQIHTDKVTLRGTVDDMQTIYGSGGLLDRFIALDFVNHLEIPFYKQVGNGYEFILEATLKPYDANE